MYEREAYLRARDIHVMDETTSRRRFILSGVITCLCVLGLVIGVGYMLIWVIANL